MGYSIAKVNLSILKQNLIKVKNNIGKTKICGVVKSNAYGHGIVQTAKAIENLVDFYAVSFLEEGLKLRYCGITKPILILIPVSNSEVFVCSRYDLSITICKVSQIDFLIKNNIKIKIHIAINSGMNRLGIDCVSQLKNIITKVKNSLVSIEGIFSHFIGLDYNLCKKQFSRYITFVKVLKQYNKKIISHISSSGPAILFKEFKEDMVRIGILMYGYFPNGKSIINVKPCLTIYAKNLQTRYLKKGENLLYGNYNLQSNKKISIIKYGYADGAKRNSAKYNNRCMDMSATSSSKKWVIVLKDAQKIANEQNTIPYEILVTYTSRCRYIYEDYSR